MVIIPFFDDTMSATLAVSCMNSKLCFPQWLPCLPGWKATPERTWRGQHVALVAAGASHTCRAWALCVAPEKWSQQVPRKVPSFAVP